MRVIITLKNAILDLNHSHSQKTLYNLAVSYYKGHTVNSYFRRSLALFIVIIPSVGFALENDSRRHTSPVPNLIDTFVSENADASKALLEQQIILLNLHTLILQEENDLLEATLDNEDMESLDQMALLLMQSRIELIKQGVQANEILKSEVGQSEFDKLLGGFKGDESGALLNDAALQLVHSNPLPNLVNFVLLNDTKPSLRHEQRERLKNWQLERAPVIAQQSQSIVDMESQLLKMVLRGDSIDSIIELSDNIAQLRVRIIRGKVFSRERVKQILQNEQYQVLLGRYPTP